MRSAWSCPHREPMTPLIAALVAEARQLAKVLDQTSSPPKNRPKQVRLRKETRAKATKKPDRTIGVLIAFDQDS